MGNCMGLSLDFICTPSPGEDELTDPTMACPPAWTVTCSTPRTSFTASLAAAATTAAATATVEIDIEPATGLVRLGRPQRVLDPGACNDDADPSERMASRDERQRKAADDRPGDQGDYCLHCRAPSRCL